MSRAVDFLGSGRLAILLLTALVLLLFLYLFITQWGPEESAQREAWVLENGAPAWVCVALGLTDIRRSAWLYGVFALLFLNLLLCMIRRFRTALVLCRFPPAPPSGSHEWSYREVPAGRLGSEDIAAFLKRKGYRTLISKDAVYGLRGRFAVVGHWVFHVSLLLLLVTGSFVAARPSPFRGTIGVGEGESFDFHKTPFLSENSPRSPEFSDLRFDMDEIDVMTDGGEVRRLEARLSTPDGGRADLAINRPYRSYPYQVMVHGFGYMPGWVIVDRSGKMLKGAWVKLLPFPLEGEDSFRIGPKTSTVSVRLHPDYRPDDLDGEDGDAVRGDDLRNPRFETRIRLLGEEIFDGLLEPDQRVPLGDGREFFFLPGIRRYLLLDVIRETEHIVIFIGLGLMILGLAVRYVRLRKEILVQTGGGSLRLSGRCEILESLFEEELDRMSGELAGASRRAAGGRVGP